MTETLQGLQNANREKIEVLRSRRRFFWLYTSVGKTSQHELREALGVPAPALEALFDFGDRFRIRNPERGVFERIGADLGQLEGPEADNERLGEIEKRLNRLIDVIDATALSRAAPRAAPRRAPARRPGHEAAVTCSCSIPLA